jgi:hypothetical protein
MKKVCLLISLAVFVGCIFQSCSKDNPLTELLPNADVVLTDGESTIDEVSMGTVEGVEKGEFLVITGTKLQGDDSGKKLLIYVKGNSDGTYPINMSPESLVNFNFKDIKGNTVIYYVSTEEYYLLVEGEITLSDTQERMKKGEFRGKVIPAHDLASAEIISTLFEGDQNITGKFRTYTVKL